MTFCRTSLSAWLVSLCDSWNKIRHSCLVYKPVFISLTSPVSVPNSHSQLHCWRVVAFFEGPCFFAPKSLHILGMLACPPPKDHLQSQLQFCLVFLILRLSQLPLLDVFIAVSPALGGFHPYHHPSVPCSCSIDVSLQE